MPHIFFISNTPYRSDIIWNYFISVSRTSFNISDINACMLMMNPVFAYLKMLLFYFCFLKLFFSGHRILDWLRVLCCFCLFLLQHLKGIVPVSSDWFYVWWEISSTSYQYSYVCDLLFLSLGTFKMFLYFSFQQFDNDRPRCGFLCAYLIYWICMFSFI